MAAGRGPPRGEGPCGKSSGLLSHTSLGQRPRCACGRQRARGGSTPSEASERSRAARGAPSELEGSGALGPGPQRGRGEGGARVGGAGREGGALRAGPGGRGRGRGGAAAAAAVEEENMAAAESG